MSRLLAIDPSLRGTGWAYFENTVLTHCGVVGGPNQLSNIEAVRAIRTSFHVVIAPDEVALEFPRIYPKGRGASDNVDPNDLLWVAAVAGALCTLGPPVTYYPSDWKGQSKKEKTLRIVLQACNPAERAVIETVQGAKRHNAVDAVGIGMYHLKRIGKNLLKDL
jgi:hypothetical protein